MKTHKKFVYQFAPAVIFIILLLQMQTISAEVQTLGTFKQNDCIILKQTCSNCTYNNITSVLYPNSTQIISQVAMTKVGTEYNYTFCNTTLLGQYTVNGKGDVDGTDTVWAYDFYINQGGQSLSVAQAILYVISLLLASGLFCLSLYFSIVIPFKNTRNDENRIVSINKLKYIKIFLIPITYLILVLIIGIVRGILADFLFLNGISELFNWIYWIMMSVLYPAIVLTFIFIVIFLFEDNILKKKIKRGSYR